ncbi:hypothetical protein [Herbiconiux liangxiaofengii]|uniref:hypothetical protein n=1 Tax=Herbiconiux liangxiaofengii TaxID=3342795 RepID=UPI0035B97309
MRARFAASVLTAALVVVGTAGCAFITPQVTADIKQATDGVNATVGQIDVRNAALISETGELASLLVTFVNNSDQQQSVTIQYEDGSTGERVSKEVDVDGDGAITTFGGTSSSADQIVLDNVSAPGSLFPVYFQYGDAEGKLVSVPVLNTSLPEYEGLAPTPTPTPTPTISLPTPTVVPTPEATLDAPADPQ